MRRRGAGAVLQALDNGHVRRLQQVAVVFVPVVLVGALALWLDAFVPAPATLFPAGVPGALSRIPQVSVPAGRGGTHAKTHAASKSLARGRRQAALTLRALTRPTPPGPAPT